MRRWTELFAIVVLVGLISIPALGQPAEEDVAAEEVRLLPDERVTGPNPSDAHRDAMRDISAEEISAATQRANRLDEAVRMTAGIDLLFGVGAER